MASPIRTHRSLIKALVVKLMPTADRADQDDACQAATIKVWQALPRYDSSKGGIGTFVYAVARLGILDEIRRQCRAARTSDLENAPEPLAPDPFVDHAIEQLVEQLREDPAQHVQGFAGRVLKDLLDHDDADDQAAAMKISACTLAGYKVIARKAVAELAQREIAFS